MSVCLFQELEWAWLLLSLSLLSLLKTAPYSRMWRSLCGSRVSFKPTLLVLVMKALRLKRGKEWPFIPRKEHILGFPVPSAEVSSALWRGVLVLPGDLVGGEWAHVVEGDGRAFPDWRQVFYDRSYHWSCCTSLEYGFFFHWENKCEG